MGRRARERAQNRSQSARITDEAWSPEVDYLFDQGLNTGQVAAALKLSPRRVREIRQFATNEGTIVIPEVRSLKEHPAEVQAMLEFSGEGFERFYNRFSGQALPAHCKAWVSAFCENRNLLLNVPPRHMKSSVFSMWVPIWLLCRDRDERILLVSLTKESSKKWVAGIAEQLTLNDDIVGTFGRFKPAKIGDAAWRPMSGTLMVSGRKKTTGVQYSVESRGSLQQILGMEATVVLVDDPTDAEIAEQTQANKRQMAWLQGEVFSRVETQTTESSGRAVVIGQRVHVRDLYGQLAAQKYERGDRIGDALWKHINTPAILRWPDEDPENPEPLVLWPEKWTYDELMVTYERVGGHAVFSAMYQQQPVSDEDSVFLAEWWNRCRDYKRPGKQGVRTDGSFLPISRVLSIDPSVRQYHALVVADVLYDAARFVPVVLETKRWKGSQRSIIHEIERCLHEYAPDYFVFEDVSFIQWLKEDPFYIALQSKTRVIPHQTGRNKGDASMGVESLAREVEFGQIRLPYGDDLGRQMSKLFEDEASAFPFGATSDVLMAMWFIKWNYRKLVPMSIASGHMKWIDTQTAEAAWSGFGDRQLA